MIQLEDLGFNATLEKYITDNKLENFTVGRVVEVHRERYKVMTREGEYEAEVVGSMRFMAKSRDEFPAVGDWVSLSTYENNFAIIHHLLPRLSVIKRQAVGQYGEIQIIATNIDYAFIVQAVDRDFNINRMERYLTICNSSGVSPILVLTKTDLISGQELSAILESIQNRIKNIPVLAISNETQEGYEAIKSTIEKGKTYCMLGSSGVGKSTLTNRLSGRLVMKTDAISQSTHKGRHVTSHRELIVLESGGILIDNPGMREIGITDAANGLETTFDRISVLSQNCRFKDCKHTTELGCAVLHALENGELDRSSYENYMKMEREIAHFESTVEEKRKKDKQFGKMLKNYKKDIQKNK